MKEVTRLIHTGLNAEVAQSVVNVPVHRASTIAYADLHSYLTRFDDNNRYKSVTYGATGSTNSRALAEAIAVLEGGFDTVVTSTGLSACTLAIGALLSQGDHVLITDSVYGPTRSYCDKVLKRYGVEVEYFDPATGGGIKDLCKPNTRLVFVESPGSLTFEMQDIAAIAEAAHSCGALVAMDNTWATPLYFKPLAHGVDISIQAGTKYISGHSDLVIGLITSATEELHMRIADHAMMQGDIASPDDCYLALRGLRTLSLRVPRHFESAVVVASWLENHNDVKRVLYPPLQSDPGHELWRRDVGGGASLFGVVLEKDNLTSISRLVDGLELFKIGSSWGGFESLVAANLTPIARDVVPWTECSVLLRFHIGLEDPDDLIDDLEAGLKRL